MFVILCNFTDRHFQLQIPCTAMWLLHRWDKSIILHVNHCRPKWIIYLAWHIIFQLHRANSVQMTVLMFLGPYQYDEWMTGYFKGSTTLSLQSPAQPNVHGTDFLTQYPPTFNFLNVYNRWSFCHGSWPKLIYSRKRSDRHDEQCASICKKKKKKSL